MHDSESYRTAARELGVFGYVGKGDFVVDLVPLIDSLVTKTPLQHKGGVMSQGAAL